MPGFAYARPGSLVEVFDLLERYGPQASLLAGGTDLVVGLQQGRLAPVVLVDLKRVADLRPGIVVAAGWLRIAAPTTLSALIQHPAVQRHFPALIEAAGMVGSVQIRNRATLAGNICNASPAADTAPVLLVHAARVVLASRSGSRRLPVAEFLLGPRRTALAPGEIVAAVELPLPEPPLGARFARLTRRRGVDLATISVCCSVGRTETRFGYGAVAPRPVLVTEPTGLLADPGADPAERDRLLAEAAGQTSPIDDIRGGRAYRQAMLLVLSRRALQVALARRDGE